MDMQSQNQNQTSDEMMRMSPAIQECIHSCLRCFQSCEQTIFHCLSMGGKHAEAKHIQLMQACAEICQTSAKFMMLQSEYHMETCRVCATVCKACAVSCEQIGGDMMLECARICRECAESCEKMSAH